MNSDPRVMEHFPGVLSREESDQLARRIRAHLHAHDFGLWAVEVRGGPPFIGFIGLNIPTFCAAFTPCVEIGWRLAAAEWNKGYATEGARAALAHGFDVLYRMRKDEWLARAASRDCSSTTSLPNSPRRT